MMKKRKFSEGLLDKKLILEEIRLSAGQTVVDAGCGSGYMAKHFSWLIGDTGTVYALDQDEELIRKLNTEVGKTNLTALVGDITQPSAIREGSVDVIYLSNVFHIFNESQRVLHGQHRC